ncbi:MAG: S8 family peptidase [Candidatus Magasanikbacteria bacterium]
MARKSITALVVGVFLLTPGLVMARVPSDIGYSDQVKFYEQIKAPVAWDYTLGSSKVVVAIIDTGADTWHPDLEKNIWINPYEIPNNKIDDDNNGFVDDINGWNFVEDNNDVRTSVFESTNDPEAVRHGTLIAGIIGATGNNNINGVGLNWNVKIMPLRAVDSSGSGSYSAISQAVVYAVKNGAHVISMSIVGHEMDTGFKDIMRWAYDQGAILVAAGGNDGYNLDENPVYPACLDKGDKENWILGVASVNVLDKLSYFSDYGSCIDIAAPGEKIYSTERYAPDYGYKNSFGGPWSGTSFATPFVAGTVALIKSLHPEWSARQIIANILDNADNIFDFNKEIIGTSTLKRLNVGRSVAIAYNSGGKFDDYVFSFKGNEIWFTTGTEKIFWRIVNEAKIVSMVADSFANQFKKELAVLIERKPYYYIRLLKNDGSFWREFSLKNFKGGVISKLVVGKDSVGQLTLVIDKYLTKTSETIWEEYSLAGELLRSAKLKGKASSWQVALDGGSIEVKIKVKGKLTSKRLEWYN